jgi:hypothetical protein
MRTPKRGNSLHLAHSEAVAAETVRIEARAATARPSNRGVAEDFCGLLTVPDVAALLHVPTSWVYDHVRKGCSNPLPAIRIGKYLRFRISDLAVYIDSLAHTPKTR